MSSSPSRLESEITAARQEIVADGYPMSIGEITNLYRDGELTIHPQFQRYYRWSDEQKSRLIESILLGIPLPSVFVSQQKDGTWELVDGLQRLSTIFQLQGILKREETVYPALVLQGTKYLPSLDGVVWEAQEPQGCLSRAQRLDIKRAKIDVKIITRDSSPAAKYDLFQRLNSLGTTLTPQELRTAGLAAISGDFVTWLQSLAKLPAFSELTRLSESQLEKQYDLDLVLRFLVLHARPGSEIDQSKLRDFNHFLDEEAFQLALAFPGCKTALERTFRNTFEQLAKSGSPDVFRALEEDGATPRNDRFLNTSYEVIALGLGYHVARDSEHEADVPAALQKLWSMKRMKGRFATGKSTEWRLSTFIPIGRKLLA